jgi:hypothetical protein
MTSHLSRVAICYLLINQIEELPNISISSALEATGSDIYVGFVREIDILKLPKSPRLHYIWLSQGEDSVQGNGGYSDFSSIEFYQIVQFKWRLFSEMLNLSFTHIIYSDFDIVWSRDPIPALLQSFETSKDLEIQIQSFTSDPNLPKLCMGFLAFRNSSEVRNLFKLCEEMHHDSIKVNPMKGDDEIITELFTSLNRPKYIRELPQSTFPVGSLLNLYITTPRMPGLKAPAPYIFHSNYVIGLENKRLMTRLFLSRHSSQLGFGMTPYWIGKLILKRTRFKLGTWKKALFNI